MKPVLVRILQRNTTNRTKGDREIKLELERDRERGRGRGSNRDKDKGELKIEIEIDLKELAHVIVKASKSKICRAEIQGRADIAAQVQRVFAGRIPSFSVEVSLFFPKGIR